jgi:glycine oxidase
VATSPDERSEPVANRRESPRATQAAALDAIIVGGGVIGLACAWRAAQRGLRVRVLERDAPGAGASGVAAGMLAPVGEATWGEEELLRLARDSHRRWPRFAAELAAASDRDPGYLELGALHIALDRDEAEELGHRFELMRSLSLEAEWLRPRRARGLEPGLSPSCAAGVHAPHESAVDPRELVAALRAAAEREGVDLRQSAQVTEGLIDGEAIRGVRTADGVEHRAERTVLAAGAWSGVAPWLHAEARPPVRPVKGQIVTLRGPAGAPVCERIVASERVYMVPREDGHLVVGATVEELGFDTRVTAGGVHELLREAYRALPEIAELELAEAIAGLRPASPDNAPVIGSGRLDGLLYATGHFRNGILLAPATADAVGAWLADAEPDADLSAFAPERFAREVVT